MPIHTRYTCKCDWCWKLPHNKMKFFGRLYVVKRMLKALWREIEDEKVFCSECLEETNQPTT